MGRGRNRKPRNIATFRLCPRPGAADASDRVFVRVDSNPYNVPGFATDDAEGDEANPSSSCTGGYALANHVRREILELGLPDDGYDYLPHLREIRSSFSSSGGVSCAAFLPSRRPARFGLPLNVKAYDARSVVVGPDDVAAAGTVRPTEEDIDLDVAKLLEESDVLPVEPEDEDLEEDFVILANQHEEEEQMVEEDFVIIGVTDDVEEEDKEGVPWLIDE